MPEVAEHIVKSFEQELKRLRVLITDMGGMVESQVALACRAVLERDNDCASRAVEADPKVDATEREVEQFVRDFKDWVKSRAVVWTLINNSLSKETRR